MFLQKHRTHGTRALRLQAQLRKMVDRMERIRKGLADLGATVAPALARGAVTGKVVLFGPTGTAKSTLLAALRGADFISVAVPIGLPPYVVTLADPAKAGEGIIGHGIGSVTRIANVAEITTRRAGPEASSRITMWVDTPGGLDTRSLEVRLLNQLQHRAALSGLVKVFVTITETAVLRENVNGLLRTLDDLWTCFDGLPPPIWLVVTKTTLPIASIRALLTAVVDESDFMGAPLLRDVLVAPAGRLMTFPAPTAAGPFAGAADAAAALMAEADAASYFDARLPAVPLDDAVRAMLTADGAALNTEVARLIASLPVIRAILVQAQLKAAGRSKARRVAFATAAAEVRAVVTTTEVDAELGMIAATRARLAALLADAPAESCEPLLAALGHLGFVSSLHSGVVPDIAAWTLALAPTVAALMALSIPPEVTVSNGGDELCITGAIVGTEDARTALAAYALERPHRPNPLRMTLIATHDLVLDDGVPLHAAGTTMVIQARRVERADPAAPTIIDISGVDGTTSTAHPLHAVASGADGGPGADGAPGQSGGNFHARVATANGLLGLAGLTIYCNGGHWP